MTALRLDDDLAEIIERATRSAEQRGWSPPPLVDVSDDATATRFARLLKYGVPYREALFVVDIASDPFRETDAVKYAKEFLAQATSPASGRAPGPVARENILVLASEQPGTGKTVACSWLLENAQPRMVFGRAFHADQHPRMIHASELAELAYREAADELIALRTTSFLVIDDLGVERLDKQEIFQRFFGALLNARYGAAGFTAITTNLTTDEMQERYGARVYDRLRERCVWLDIAHGSLRGVR